MRSTLGFVLLGVLLTHLGAHLSMAIALARMRRFRHAVMAIGIAPLAPFWGWREGMRSQVYVWAITLALYAALSALLALA